MPGRPKIVIVAIENRLIGTIILKLASTKCKMKSNSTLHANLNQNNDNLSSHTPSL